MFIFKEEIVERKKVVVSKNEVQFYVFGTILKNVNNHHLDQLYFASGINTLNLEKAIFDFDKMQCCDGGLDLGHSPPNWKSDIYREDIQLHVWRHISCLLVEKLVPLKEGRLCCVHCKKVYQAVRSFQCRTKKIHARRLCSKIHFVHKEKSRKMKAYLRLKRRFSSLNAELLALKQKFKTVDEHSVLQEVESMDNVHPSQKLLIAECIRQCKYTKKTSRRYTSDWLLLCLLLHIRNPASYNFLRTNEILPLPAVSTMRRYLSRVNLKCGLDESFFEAFKKKMKERSQYEQHGLLIFDEMQVKESINLNVKTMKLVGVQDFGTESAFTSKSSDKRANHALVFMFTSLGTNFTQPVAVFAAKGATKGTCLAQLLLAIIKKLEKSGAIVDGVVCDGATTNRKMWSEFGISGKIDEPVNKILHPMDDNRHMYFFSDAPHLIKCIRNRLLNQQKLVVGT